MLLLCLCTGAIEMTENSAAHVAETPQREPMPVSMSCKYMMRAVHACRSCSACCARLNRQRARSTTSSCTGAHGAAAWMQQPHWQRLQLALVPKAAHAHQWSAPIRRMTLPAEPRHHSCEAVWKGSCSCSTWHKQQHPD